jgi:hypothetical protein
VTQTTVRDRAVEAAGVTPRQDPEGQLERALIDEFLRMHGHDATSVASLPAEERTRLLQAASVHACARLAEIEARAHFVHELHGNQ